MITMMRAELEAAEARGDLRRPVCGRFPHTDRDVSGPGEFGYAYENRETGEQSITIWVSDGNPTTGRPGSGSFVVRFARAAIARADRP